jgi:hypothetical protein
LFLRFIEVRGNAHRKNDGSSPDDPNDPDPDPLRRVDYVCTVGQTLYAFEHTRIEPFPNQIRLAEHNQKLLNPIIKRFDHRQGGKAPQAVALTPEAEDPRVRGWRRASVCSSAATCLAFVWTLGGNEAGENCSFGMTARERIRNRQDPVHPWRRPRAFGRKNPLHVDAQVDAALGQRKRQQLITHATLSLL